MDTPALAAAQRLLIIDDNVEAAELLKELLEMDGYRADIAHTAAQGRAALHAQPYTAALVDLSLPDQHGTELARQLHEAPPAGGLPTLVAVTGHERGGPLAGKVDRYFDHFLQKPLDIDVLGRLLARITTGR